MKIILLSLTIAFFSIKSLAQKIKIKKGIAYVNAIAYCKIEGEGNLFENKSLSIFSLADEELIFVKDVKGTNYCNFTFLESKQKVKIDVSKVGLNFRNEIIKLLFKNKVIDSNKIQANALQNFILKYEYDEDEFYNQINNNQNRNGYSYGNYNGYYNPNFIDRDRNATIYISNNNVNQDGKNICRYTTKSNIVNSKIIETYNFYYPNGDIIAELTIEKFIAPNNSLYIFRNNATSVLTGFNNLELESTIIDRVIRVLMNNRIL